jgi:hypothetical protein
MYIDRVRNCPDRDHTLVGCHHTSSFCGGLIKATLALCCPKAFPQARLTWETALFLGGWYKTARCHRECGKHVTLCVDTVSQRRRCLSGSLMLQATALSRKQGGVGDAVARGNSSGAKIRFVVAQLYQSHIKSLRLSALSRSAAGSHI